MLYLFMDEKKDCTLIKIGYTKDLENREHAYKTANPLVKKIAYTKLDQKAEKEFQIELSLLGFERIDNTEWYKVPRGIADYIEFYGFNSFETSQRYNKRSYIYGSEKWHDKPYLKLKDYIR